MANTHSLDLELSSSQYASIADASQTGLDLTGNDISIECWFNPETLGITQVLVSKWQSNTTPQHIQYLLYLDTNNKLNFYFASDATHFSNFISNAAVTSSTGVYVHLAITADVSANTVVMYVNGSSVASTTSSSNATSIGNDTSPFYIGCNYDTSAPANFADGLIDDVRVWSDVRTSAEIAAYYKQELSGTEANLVGYWKLNNNYLDETTNNNDLTASGSPVFSTSIPFTENGFFLFM